MKTGMTNFNVNMYNEKIDLNLNRFVQIFFCIFYISKRKFGCRNKSPHTFYISNYSCICKEADR